MTTRTRTDAIATQIASCCIEIARRGARMPLIHSVRNTSFVSFCKGATELNALYTLLDIRTYERDKIFINAGSKLITPGSCKSRTSLFSTEDSEFWDEMTSVYINGFLIFFNDVGEPRLIFARMHWFWQKEAPQISFCFLPDSPFCIHTFRAS